MTASLDVSRVLGSSVELAPLPPTARSSQTAKWSDTADEREPPVLPVTTIEPASGSATALAYPDGGPRAWFVVLGGFCATLTTIGHNNAFGVYQEFYGSSLLAEYSASTISWIGSIQFALLCLVGLFSGRLFDEGRARVSVAIGSVVCIVCIFMTSLASTYWQLLLSQGIGQGLGCGLIFAPAYSACFHYFSNKRGLVVGIQSAGGGLGGIVISLMLRSFFTGSIGFGWGVRIVGFMLASLLVISSCLVRTRLPPRKPAKLLTASVLSRDVAFSFYLANAFVVSLGLYAPYYYLPTFSTEQGLSQSFSFYTVTILNAGGILGRLVGNRMGDRWGALNIYITTLGLNTVLLLCWSAVKGQPGIAVFAVLYGITSGAAISGLPACVGSLSWDCMQEIGSRGGMLFAFEGVAVLIGPPIAGAILRSPSGFLGTSMYAAASSVGALALAAFSRVLLAKRRGQWQV